VNKNGLGGESRRSTGSNISKEKEKKVAKGSLGDLLQVVSCAPVFENRGERSSECEKKKKAGEGILGGNEEGGLLKKWHLT